MYRMKLGPGFFWPPNSNDGLTVEEAVWQWLKEQAADKEILHDEAEAKDSGVSNMAIYPQNNRATALERAWTEKFVRLNEREPNDLDRLNMTNSILIDLMCEVLDKLES